MHTHTPNTQNDTKQTIHRTTQKLWKGAGRALSLRGLLWHLPYNRGKRKSHCSRRVPVGTMKIHKRTILIHYILSHGGSEKRNFGLSSETFLLKN